MIHSSKIMTCTQLPIKEAVKAFCDHCSGGIRICVMVKYPCL